MFRIVIFTLICHHHKPMDLIPSKSFLIQHSPIILPSKAVQSSSERFVNNPERKYVFARNVVI
jgi:hypothetical protein